MADGQVHSEAYRLAGRVSEVPNMAPGSSQLLVKLMDVDVGIRDVQSAVGQFAVIVGKLISLANSAWSNPNVAVTTLDAACTRLGLNVVRTVSIALVVGRSFNVSNCPGFDLTRYWASSIITSEIASTVASQFEVDAMSARAAGLLHNIGMLWLADRLPKETSSALSVAHNEPGASVSCQMEQYCGVGYRDVGFQVMTQWNLPDILLAGAAVPAAADEREHLLRMHSLIVASSRIAARVCKGEEFPECEAGFEHEASFQNAFQVQRSKLSNTLEMANALIRT